MVLVWSLPASTENTCQVGDRVNIRAEDDERRESGREAENPQILGLQEQDMTEGV